MTDFPLPRRINIGAATLAVYEADGHGDHTRPPVILVHGWPEIAYSWKNQLGPLAEAGHRVIAIDLKGFGQSDAPHPVELYDAAHMSDDLCGLLDALGIERAIFCGHDWGGALVWRMAQLHPERTAGVISLCTPLHPRPPAPPIAILNKRFGDLHYFVQFQKPDAPERLFETNPDLFFKMMFQRPVERARWASLIPAIYDLSGRFQHARAPTPDRLVLNEADLQLYVDAFRHSGFHGGINLYRNVDRNWETMANRDEQIHAPALWIGAELDLFLPPETADGMEKLIPDLEKHVIADCGHWMSWEKPAEANALMVDWLNRRFSI